jgi:integrase
MPTKKLTAVSIPHLVEGEWYDAVLPGLILRVGVKRRTWQFRYHAGGSYHRKPLGHFPAMELGEARDAARRVIERAEKGVPIDDPVPHPRSPDVLTLGGLLDRYEAMRLREGRRIKVLAKTQRALRRHLKPYLSLPADQFSKADLRAVRDAMVEAGTVIEANRLLEALGPAMRWAAEEDLIPVNFVPAIRRAAPRKRDRVLTQKEIAAIWKACETLGRHKPAKSYARMVRFLLVSAQRRDEAASLRYGHILDGVWRQTENKASRPHSLPLPSLALALVGRGEAREYVFGGRSGKIGAFSMLKRKLDEASGVTGWRLHDLRRTAASSLQELGIRNEVVQSVLNHAVPGVGGVYLRSELEKQRAEALATWAERLARIVERSVVVVS